MSIENKLKERVSYHSGVKAEDVSSEMYLEGDLGITGDDAFELIEDIQKLFDLDLTEFDFSLHFVPEAGGIKNSEYGYYPVSVGHLIEVCNRKSWFLPDRDLENHQKFKRALLVQNVLAIGVFTCALMAILLVLSNECA
ncbi:DUF1493 family protein [Microbulbifer thermotolerans]|uniref:acyl carrier protein n=1 Tax=Microbulbifer thermotolerans TaxID=252514 RepID=UPI00224B2D59|nr:DUF1493 family protein [Microbulbifer thermotolerans]MCX2781530.1 DUF1493 family protein [Microbulbifer thermotolerans]